MTTAGPRAGTANIDGTVKLQECSQKFGKVAHCRGD